MVMMEQSRLPDFDPDNREEPIEDWTFAGADTKYMTHGLHPYPARMIPQVARKLIERYSEKDDLVWDPFCGSGSVLVESMLTGRASVGTDLNPFAVFLSKVKTSPIDSDVLRRANERLSNKIASVRKQFHGFISANLFPKWPHQFHCQSGSSHPLYSDYLQGIHQSKYTLARYPVSVMN